MLISHKFKLIFIKVYKNASSYVTQLLYKLDKDIITLDELYPDKAIEFSKKTGRSFNHIRAREAKEILNTNIWNNYTKICIIRNSWDWEMSLYHYMKYHKPHFQHDIIKNLSVEEYCNWRKTELHSQSNFVLDNNNNSLVDTIFKFENLDEELIKFFKKNYNLDITINLSNKKINVSKRKKDYKIYYNEITKNIIAKIHEKDISYFNFDYDTIYKQNNIIKLNNINAIWGQVEQPKTSNDKVTYHGDYHTFGDIDTSQFTDEVLVWHRPEFLKEEWRYGLYGIKNREDSNYVKEEDVITIELDKKVICIGMYKTGTTSMNKALDILNFKSDIIFNKSTTRVVNKNIGITLKDSLILRDYEIEKKIKKHNNWNIIKDKIKTANNFGDGPWLYIYKEFYKLEPNSKFILTLRNPEEVAKSDIAMWIRNRKPLEPINYFELSDGVANSYEELKTILINRYLKHVEDVRDFFKDKQEQLLELDISQENNPWIKLCEFLNCAIPTCDFPHLNRKL